MPKKSYATRDKYQKYVCQPPFANNVIFVKAGIHRLIDQALKILSSQQFPFINLVAYDKTAPSAITMANILREKFPKLHEIIVITNIEKFYHYEPLEEGLIDLNVSVKIPSIIIKLTFNPTQEETLKPGYQRSLFDERFTQSFRDKDPVLRELYDNSQFKDLLAEESQGDDEQEVEQEGETEVIDQFDNREFERKFQSDIDLRSSIRESIIQHKDIYKVDSENLMYQFNDSQINNHYQNQKHNHNHQYKQQFQQQQQENWSDGRFEQQQEFFNYSHNFQQNQPDEDGFQDLPKPKQNQKQTNNYQQIQYPNHNYQNQNQNTNYKNNKQYQQNEINQNQKEVNYNQNEIKQFRNTDLRMKRKNDQDSNIPLQKDDDVQRNFIMNIQ